MRHDVPNVPDRNGVAAVRRPPTSRPEIAASPPIAAAVVLAGVLLVETSPRRRGPRVLLVELELGVAAARPELAADLTSPPRTSSSARSAPPRRRSPPRSGSPACSWSSLRRRRGAARARRGPVVLAGVLLVELELSVAAARPELAADLTSPPRTSRAPGRA